MPNPDVAEDFAGDPVSALRDEVARLSADLAKERAIVARVIEKWNGNSVMDWDAVDDDMSYHFVEKLTRGHAEWSDWTRRLEAALSNARAELGAAPSVPPAAPDLARPLTEMETRIGVIRSTGSDGKETRISVKRWLRDDGSAPSDCLTIAHHVGEGMWIETGIKVEDALRLASLIEAKAGRHAPAMLA